jgi:uncharacterized protein DUF6431
VTRIDLQQIPRWCPLCCEKTIIGHGRRRRQAHDQHHDWIWVRRGRCRPCGKTFTILPSWSSPHGHYSFHCRQQAWELMCQHGSWEQSAPHTKDPARLPDPSTLRRWACRGLVSLWQGVQIWRLAAQKFFKSPTILAWDWPAARRILRLEANAP